MSQIIYLHGWASSPFSDKARFFAQQFQHCNIPLTIPDLNQPDFYNLTLSRQIAQVRALITSDEVTLIGSSLGGLTALWVAESCPQVKRVVTLAPALNFLQAKELFMGSEQVQQWKTAQELAVYHYAAQEEKLIHYNFIADMVHYPDNALQRVVPTLMLHGQHDEVINYRYSYEFSQSRSWVDYHLLDSDHGLNDVQDMLWQHVARFLSLA